MLSLSLGTCVLALAVKASAGYLGTAAPFGVLGASTGAYFSLRGPTAQASIANLTGSSHQHRSHYHRWSLGVSPGTAITGFTADRSGPVHSADAVAGLAQNDAHSAFTTLNGLEATADLTGEDLGEKTITPGVYSFRSSVGITGALTLDAQGNNDALFVFQIGSTITTATAASVILVNGAQACNIYWVVGSSATLGTSTQFVGNVIALASITVNSAVRVTGGLSALTAAITLIDDNITA